MWTKNPQVSKQQQQQKIKNVHMRNKKNRKKT